VAAGVGAEGGAVLAAGAWTPNEGAGGGNESDGGETAVGGGANDGAVVEYDGAGAGAGGGGGLE